LHFQCACGHLSEAGLLVVIQETVNDERICEIEYGPPNFRRQVESKLRRETVYSVKQPEMPAHQVDSEDSASRSNAARASA
jgi:hypothetical protein